MSRAAGTKPNALVTGASSGIGEALARQLARRGYDIVLVARRRERLEALAADLRKEFGARAWAVEADLVDPRAASKLAAAMKRARRPIDLLVNNAGVMAVGEFTAMAPARHEGMIALNVLALTRLIEHFVPPMVARGSGRVLNVASIAAFQPVPRLATYAATKAYVLSLTEALAEELRGTGVTVTALCPGFTATEMLTGAQHDGALTKLPGFLVSSADAVAAEGIDACLAGEVIHVAGVLNQAAILAGRATPRWLLRRAGGAMARRMK